MTSGVQTFGLVKDRQVGSPNFQLTHIVFIPDLSSSTMGDPRELGNKFFFERKYEQALDCYSEAIVSLCITIFFHVMHVFTSWGEGVQGKVYNVYDTCIYKCHILAFSITVIPGPRALCGGGGGTKEKAWYTLCNLYTYESTFSTKYTILKLIGYFCQHVAKYSIPRSWVD